MCHPLQHLSLGHKSCLLKQGSKGQFGSFNKFNNVLYFTGLDPFDPLWDTLVGYSLFDRFLPLESRRERVSKEVLTRLRV